MAKRAIISKGNTAEIVDYTRPNPTQADIDSEAALHIKSIDLACREHLNSGPHGLLSFELEAKANANKPKSKAVRDWRDDCLNQLDANTDLLNSGAAFNSSMLIYPPCPHSMREIRDEV